MQAGGPRLHLGRCDGCCQGSVEPKRHRYGPCIGCGQPAVLHCCCWCAQRFLVPLELCIFADSLRQRSTWMCCVSTHASVVLLLWQHHRGWAGLAQVVPAGRDTLPAPAHRHLQRLYRSSTAVQRRLQSGLFCRREAHPHASKEPAGSRWRCCWHAGGAAVGAAGQEWPPRSWSAGRSAPNLAASAATLLLVD
jgi:hypothetical protein